MTIDIDTKPANLVLTAPVSFRLTARVCCDCGLSMLYVRGEDRAKLVETVATATANQNG